MRMRRALIVKDARVRICYEVSHLHIVSFYSEQFIGFEQISACYFHHHIDLNIQTAIYIAKKVPLYFIETDGTILAAMSFDV